MKPSEIGRKRLENLIAFDDGIDRRELAVFEKEIRRIISEYFTLKNKDVRITFRRSGEGIDINVFAEAEEVKELKVI